MLRSARRWWRSARSAPGLGGVLSGVDRHWWAHVIRRARVVDADFVAAQVGRPISARAAVRRYVRGTDPAFSLNPLFCEARVSRQLSDADRVPALYAYLVNDRRRLDVSPNWDSISHAELHPSALEDPAGPLGDVWRRAQLSGSIRLGRSGRQSEVSWARLTELAARAARAESLQTAALRPLPGAPEVIGILGPAEDEPDVAILSMLDATGRLEASLRLGVAGGGSAIAVQAALLTLWVPEASLTVERSSTAEDLQDRLVDAAAGAVVTRGEGAAISADDLVAIARAAVAGAVVSPLRLGADGTVGSAGIVVHEGRAIRLLHGHPPEDARALGERITVAARDSTTFARPAVVTSPPETLLKATVIDDSAPAGDDVPSRQSRGIDDLLAPAGLEFASWSAPGIPRLRRRVAPARAEARPNLRWAIRTAAPAGRTGEAWGDTHFARGLADGLRRLGQEVVIDPFPARDRDTTYLDDVTLVLRGPERIDPPRSGRSIQWIISHPDEIEADEVSQFDAVFAASLPWAAEATARYGVRIAPLLQCTDTTRFHPTGAPRSDEIVFVGTARGIARPAVVDPIAAGIPVSVYGPDWRGYIPAANITATGIPNTELPSLYERAAVVLNDHWPAMREHGFVSNRPFDVVAAGGRVISDQVAGIGEIFGGSVRVFRNSDELVSLLRADLDAEFPAEDELAAIGARIRAEHSFDARARSLLDAVTP